MVGQLQLGPALMAGNGGDLSLLRRVELVLQLGPALMAGNGGTYPHHGAGRTSASIGPGADGREWAEGVVPVNPGLLLQLGPALMAGNGGMVHTVRSWVPCFKWARR